MAAFEHTEGDARPRRGLAAALAGALALASILPRTAPGVTFEDAGELAAAAACWGVPHPPGYPLWMMIAAPVANLAEIAGLDPARALVLLSALAAAGVCALLAAAARCLRASTPVATAAGLLPLAAPTFLSQSLIVEVYALAALFQAALIVRVLGSRARPGQVGLLFGLGLAGHLSTVLLAPLAVAGALRGGVRGIPRAAVGVAAGLTLFAYVPLAAAREAAVNWGGASTLGRLADHLARSQYGGSGGELGPKLAFVLEQLVQQWPLLAIGGVLLAAALARSVPRGGRLALLLAATLLFAAVGSALALPYDVTPIELRVRVAPMFIPVLLVVAALAGLGLAGLEQVMRPKFPRAASAIAMAVALALALVPARSISSDATHMARADGAQRYLESTLQSCPERAILVVSHLGYTDVLSFPLVYGQVALGLRPDVTVIDRALLRMDWYREQLARRAPDLAQPLATLAHTYDSDPARFADARQARLASAEFLQALFEGPRPVALMARPGPNVLRGRTIAPSGAVWLIGHEQPTVIERWEWLAHQPPSPWTRELSRLAEQRLAVYD